MATNKKSRKKVIIFSLILVLLLAVVLLVVLGSNREPVINVQTEKVARRTVTQTVTATGKISPEVQVIITPEVSGEIIELPVREGMKVKRGAMLMKIKPDIYLALRDRSTAGQTSARASLVRSESEFKRVTELFSKGLVAESELELAKTSFEIAKASYDQASAALNQANEDLRKTTIYSPMDGTVSQLKVELGERVLGTSQFQGTTVMTIADLTRMEARVDVGENDVVLISIGDTTRISVDAYPDRKLTGIVYEIANTAKTKGLGTQEEVTNFEVKIRIIDKDLSLRPGMSMTASIETETRKNVLTVPIQSVTTRSQNKEKEQKQESGEDEQPQTQNQAKAKANLPKVKEIVFVAENGSAKSFEVKRGIADDAYVEIMTGIAEGNEIISGSYKAINRELEEGSKIKVDNARKKPDNEKSK
jgi:HlyD family secretion protein